MIYLYTEELFFLAKLKTVVKIFLKRNQRGPKTVIQSLQNGFKELNIQFILNSKKPGTIACVLGNHKTLEWAIAQKQKGSIKKIIAGPNICVTALDYNKLLANKLIDIIITPSQWVYENYAQDLPEVKSKLRIWPAGIKVPKELINKKSIDFIVYNKIGNSELYVKILEYLIKAGLSFKVFNYGQFSQEDYFKALEETKFLIYLSETESQGLAMFEAWARNVPVFAWERGFWEVKNSRQTGFTATPYLTSESGQRFKNIEEFKSNLQSFITAVFKPRTYVLENFSNAVSAKKYLNIVKELE